MGKYEKIIRNFKIIMELLLTGAVLAGTVLSGCGSETDYTAEIKEYQDKLECLRRKMKS